MQVDKNNFSDVLDEFEYLIQESSFVAIDFELSGLNTGEYQQAGVDTASERYFKIRDGVIAFMPLQLGVCLVKWNPSKKTYEAAPFNFQLFPQVSKLESKAGVKRKFFLDPGAFKFLSENKFDFNKAISTGISFLRPDQMDLIRDFLKKQDDERKMSAVSRKEAAEKEGKTVLEYIIDEMTSEESRKKVIGYCEEIDSWLEKMQKKENTRTTRLQESQMSSSNLVLSKKNPYERYLIRDIVENGYPTVVVDTHENSSSSTAYMRDVFLVYAPRPEDRELFSAKEKRIKEQELLQSFGVGEIVRMLVERKKPLIGHNSMIDLLHVCQHMSFPLPEDYAVFKRKVSECFPKYFDTKYIGVHSAALSEILPSGTGLGQMFDSLKKSENSRHPFALLEGFESYESVELAHEAGFDAYMTAFCFVQEMGHLVEGRVDVGVESEEILAVEGMIPMFRSMTPNYSLRSVESEEWRNDTYYVQNFVQSVDTNEIRKWFPSETFGKVAVSWVDDTSCCVRLFTPLSERDKEDERKRKLQDVKKLSCEEVVSMFQGEKKFKLSSMDQYVAENCAHMNK